MSRYLCIDHGLKRIGLAVGDSESKIASPLPQMKSRGTAIQDSQLLKDIILQYDINALLVGIPYNMDGSEGPQARTARTYGTQLGKALNLSVEFVDERLSSFAADTLLRTREELTRKKRKARQDSIAAVTILQDFLDTRTS